MIIDRPLLKTILINLPFNQSQYNLTFLSSLRCHVCRTLWGLKMELNPVLLTRFRSFPLKRIVGFAGFNDGFREIDELGHNELVKSGFNPLHIGYGVENFEVGAQEYDFDSGDDHGGKGDGGHGSGGNGGNEPSGSEPNDGLRGLGWWWFWQWNRALQARKGIRITLRLNYNARDQLIDLALQILAAELLLLRDMMNPTIMTKHAIQDFEGLLSLVHEVLLCTILLPQILFEIQGAEPIFVATVYGILGASVLMTAVVSGVVVYGLWRWHNSFQDHDSNQEDTDS